MRDTIQHLTPDLHRSLFLRLAAVEPGVEELWAMGNLQLLASNQSAVLVDGARASTAYGEHVATEFVRELAEDHTIITTGAFGIAAAAARATLEAGFAPVIVLPSGLDVPFPSGNRDLFDQILERGGLILSPYPSERRPSRFSFMRRSQVAAHLADVTVVVEAGPRSPAVWTGAQAAAAGRTVAAVPGPITSAMSKGCHTLIRDNGAHLVVSAAEISELVLTARQ
ncbi:DNA-processing protein DprA [Leucobacter sp. HNU]|uniref:DNA-processing protein DprA n=1 Tax=Leucobacter sp. HNU TaxID=3236805 RepID=UPI003A7FB801